MKTPTRRLLINFLAVVGFTVFFLLSSLWWMKLGADFPDIESGQYVGELVGYRGEGRIFRWYLQRDRSSRTVEVLFFSGDGGVLRSELLAKITQNEIVFLPLRLVSDKVELELTGTETSPGQYEGSFRDLRSGTTGRWNLKKTLSEDPSRLINDRLWLEEQLELVRVRDALVDAQQYSSHLVLWIDRLSDLILQPDLLKDVQRHSIDATEKVLSESSTMLSKLARSFSEEKAKAAFELSLVSELESFRVWREVRESEEEWLLSLAATSSLDSGQALEDLRRVERYQQLQESIRLEQERIAAIRSGL